MQAVLVDPKGLPISSITELATSIRNIPTLTALPVVALAFGLPPSAEKDLKAAGVSIVNRPLRYPTLASVLHEAMGLLPKAPPKKKVNNNVKLLTGKRLLVVILYSFHPANHFFPKLPLSSKCNPRGQSNINLRHTLQ